MCIWLQLETFVCINSLTPKSVPVGAQPKLFGKYIANFYVRIDEYILREMKTWHATIYLMTQRTNQQILNSTKKYFDPLLTSSMLQASYKSQATDTKLRSLRIQRAIKLCERIKIGKSVQ